MNDGDTGGTKGAGYGELKGLAARAVPDEQAQGSVRPSLRALPDSPTLQSPAAPVEGQWESSPFNRKIEKARRDVEQYEREIDDAWRDRDKARAEGEALIAVMESSGRTLAGERELEEFRNQYDGAVGRYLQADGQRLKVKTRLGSLFIVRERWLLERDLCFHNPDDPARPLSHEELRERLAGRDR